MTNTERRELTAAEIDLVSGGFALSALDAAGKDPLWVARNALVFSGDAYDNEMG